MSLPKFEHSFGTIGSIVFLVFAAIGIINTVTWIASFF